jgi:hypothetical protein
MPSEGELIRCLDKRSGGEPGKAGDGEQADGEVEAVPQILD